MFERLLALFSDPERDWDALYAEGDQLQLSYGFLKNFGRVLNFRSHLPGPFAVGDESRSFGNLSAQDFENLVAGIPDANLKAFKPRHYKGSCDNRWLYVKPPGSPHMLVSWQGSRDKEGVWRPMPLLTE